ncbi:hypothetical protein Esi_0142_0002 [Ectocarpus siliculosus]|uniref:Uncharacterized protein n=1 Tax=Ectocarpus siliculosus TaxID=2880 RepID=D7FK71_ECTSI|nr:hypothetical protein Esi_0142_0002 [Ectocarpus siliculosus]|eukprot:CBJ29276.1 hypothetical protein Esi_0142_0002 [Ectocarpus siliculosus]
MAAAQGNAATLHKDEISIERATSSSQHASFPAAVIRNTTAAMSRGTPFFTGFAVPST